MTSPKLHHVVYCHRPENQERAADLWRDLGLTFQEIQLAEEGLRVLLDWSAGIELVAPSEPEGTESARFRAFLDEHGEGVVSVVVRTDDVEGPLAVATRHGATVRYRQHRETGDVVVDEVDLHPVHGMAVTLLATNLPD
ncbi:MAG TPA: glyoxalase [Acidimicrobiia bacterium]|nr:glyoxalase [Acidimicrobiia bacterium]